MIYPAFIKRALDLGLSALALLVLGPLILAGALAVMASSAGPAFFTQRRVGLQGRPFVIYKLRTMSVDPHRPENQTAETDPDVLPVGRILRRLKIDELPQLVNVFIGDMSLIGPRPCLWSTFRNMPEWAKRRCDVRPGITGLAQINGNVALSWEERWKYDVQYVDSCSLAMDIGIALKTVLVVVRGEQWFARAL